MNPADSQRASQDLEFIRGVIDRTDQRVDPHAFHYVHWGLIVMVWYPLAKMFEIKHNLSALIWIGAGAIGLGIFLSVIRERKLLREPRLPAENTFVSNQMMQVTFLCIAAGVVLSAIAPSTGFIDGREIPTMWGLVYATMATMLGVVYRRSFLYAGIFIFAGAIAAIIFQEYNGFILGPTMGLGMIVPGLQAEARVKRLQAETTPE